MNYSSAVVPAWRKHVLLSGTDVWRKHVLLSGADVRLPYRWFIIIAESSLYPNVVYMCVSVDGGFVSV